jgi:hypothetical protein
LSHRHASKGVEEFKLGPKQDSLMRNDQGKNHIFVKYIDVNEVEGNQKYPQI